MADDSMISTPTSDIHDDTFDTEGHSVLAHESHIQNSTTDKPSSFPANTSAHLNALHPREVSPPRSQETTPAIRSSLNGNDHDNSVSVLDRDEDEDEGIAMGDDEDVPSSGLVTPGTGGNDAGEQDRLRRRRVGERDDGPGAGWKNKKAQEEMARAWEFVVDRDWNVRQYGDPLGHKAR